VAPVLASLTLRVSVGVVSNGMAKKWPCLSWKSRQMMVKQLNLSKGLHRQIPNDEDAQEELDKAVVGGFWLGS
jgi:hypothetical protein